MNTYALYEFGIECADHDDLHFCYESVRDEFFNDISGDDFYIEKAKASGVKAKLSTVKQWIVANKKKIALLAAAVAGLFIIAAQLRKKKALKEADALLEKAKEYKKECESLKKQMDELKSSYDTVKKTISHLYADEENEINKVKKENPVYNSHHYNIDAIRNKYAYYNGRISRAERNARDNAISDKWLHSGDKRREKERDVHFKYHEKRRPHENVREDIESKMLDIKIDISHIEREYSSVASKFNTLAKKYRLKPIAPEL